MILLKYLGRLKLNEYLTSVWVTAKTDSRKKRIAILYIFEAKKIQVSEIIAFSEQKTWIPNISGLWILILLASN